MRFLVVSIFSTREIAQWFAALRYVLALSASHPLYRISNIVTSDAKN
jgi:hypothetical protein